MTEIVNVVPKQGESKEEFIPRCIAYVTNEGKITDQEQISAQCYSVWEQNIKQNIYMLPINGVIGEDFKYTDLLMHLNRAKDSSIIKLIINSPGGFVEEADKIRDSLENCGKSIIATNSGDVASAAVDIFLVAPKSERTFNPLRGEFLIHFPFLSPEDGGVTGTSDEIASVADDLKDMEKIFSKRYEKATGTDSNIITGFMGENIPLTPEQIEGLGFATLIKQELKAVAYYKPKINEMENKEVMKKLSAFEVILKKIASFIKPKALMLQDVNGVEIDFGNEIETPEQIVVGVKATIDGSPATDDHTMPTGEVYKFEAGELKEIVPVETENEEMQKLREENESLKTQLAESQAKAQEAETTLENVNGELTKLNKDFYAFRNQFSKGDTGENTGESGKSKIRKAFN